MAFGAGVLISAAAFELTEEAYRSAGGVAAALGLLTGIGWMGYQFFRAQFGG